MFITINGSSVVSRRRLSGCLMGLAVILICAARLAVAGNPVAPPPAPPPAVRSAPSASIARVPRVPVVSRVTLARETPRVRLSPQTTLRERAEDLSGVTLEPAVPVYPVVQSAVVSEGTNAFHLAHPDFVDHIITVDTPILVQADSRAFFESRLRLATPSQEARFQVSTNSGTSWTTLWSQAGDGTSGEAFFKLVDLDLSAYAGSVILLRFWYAFTGGSAYTGTESHVGWFVDDIQVGPDYITRAYSGFGDPSALEVLAVEFINRARSDAAAEAIRLRNDDDPHVVNAVNFFNVDFDEMEAQFSTLDPVVPPLAINGRLMAAARLHSQDMFDNVFQGHTSSSDPPPPHQPGDSPGTRALHQGYPWQTIAENVYAYGQSVWHSHAAYNIDWGSGAWHGMQVPPGHRIAIHNPDYREVGIGIVEGNNQDNGSSVGPVLSTQVFATEQGAVESPFLVGVTYAAHAGSFYDPAYALGGVTVRVDGSSMHAVSSTHGAYALPLAGDGAYTVTFVMPDYTTFTTNFTVSNGENVKIDYVAHPASSLPIEMLSRRSDGGLRFEVEHAGAAETLRVNLSFNFSDWDEHAAVFTALPGNRVQVDCAPLVAPFGFFKVTAANE